MPMSFCTRPTPGRIFRFGILLLLCMLFAGLAQAQQRADFTVRNVRQLAPEVVPAPAEICTYHAAPYRAAGAVRPRLRTPEARPRQETATIAIDFLGPEDDSDYEEFPPAARQALRRAADIWETHVASDVEVRVAASYEPLDTDEDEGDGSVLASAGPTFIFAATVNGTQSAYGSALIDALIGTDQRPQDPDIVARFNSDRDDWYFGTGTPGPEQIDFTSVAVHELAHGLGFFGSMTVVDDQGSWGFEFEGLDDVVPAIYDQFAEDGDDTALLNEDVYPNPSMVLADALEGQRGGLFFGGPQARVAEQSTAGGERPELYAPDEWNQGSSYSHLDEETYPEGDQNALMTPLIGFQEIAQSPGAITCGMFADMDWPLGPGCEALLDIEPIEFDDNEALVDAYPNPFHTQLTLRIAARETQRVEILIYNVLGQRLRTVPVGRVRDQYTYVTIDARGLASGQYLVRVVGERFEETEKVVLVR